MPRDRSPCRPKGQTSAVGTVPNLGYYSTLVPVVNAMAGPGLSSHADRNKAKLARNNMQVLFKSAESILIHGSTDASLSLGNFLFSGSARPRQVVPRERFDIDRARGGQA